MTESEIIEVLAKTRGTILCLGLKDIPPLSMFGISDKHRDLFNVLIIPTNKRIFSKELKCYIRGIEWRIVNYTLDLPVDSLLVVSSVAQIDKNNLAHQEQDYLKAYLDSLCSNFNLQAISLVDSFPFHTKEGLHLIEEIRKFCLDKNLTFKVGLLYGVNKYGSTDISTEDDAVEQEKFFLRKEKNIECIEINQTLTVDNVLDFFIQASSSLKQAVEKFEDACRTTIQNLELFAEILYSFLQISLNYSLTEYITSVKNQLKEFEIFFPISKYLNETFFDEYSKAIASKFNKKKDSTNNEVSQWCVNTLTLAIKQWIKLSKITIKNEK